MFKKKNITLLYTILIVVLAIYIYIVINFVYQAFALEANQIQCGNSKYILFADFDIGEKTIYNVENETMFWKWGTINKSISSSKSDFKTLVYINKNQPQQPQPDVMDFITFIPEYDTVTKNDIENLRQCYPASEYTYKVIDIDDVFSPNPASWQTPESVYD